MTRYDPALAGDVPAKDAFRADIQGLRAISVLLVVLFHVNDGIVGGGFFGVDVFFVISGFLITSLLLREYEATGSVNLLAFLARRARRLLPNATLVLLCVLVAGSILLSPFEFGPLASDVFAAALYFANFHFASTSVDYFLSNRNPSAVVHFWSLSIEEQFYLVWPPVLLLIGLARRSLPFKNLAAAALALAWTRAGHRVAIIRDTPLAEVSYKDCILANMGGAGCERSRERALNPNLIEQRVAAAHPGVFLLDVSDRMCGPETCPVIIDDNIVYRDDSHMTATFAATLAGAVGDVLAAVAATWRAVPGAS